MSCGRLEAEIVVPTGGWSLTLSMTVLGVPVTPAITFTAADRYTPSELLTALQTKLNAANASDGAFTVAADLTDRTGTGRVTITHTVENFTLLAGSADLVALLGMNPMTPAALTFTGVRPMRGVWLPDSEISSAYGDGDAGHTESDRGENVAPDGTVRALVYGERVRQPWIRWDLVTREKARTAAEATLGESFETWWLDTHGGRYSYFEAAPQVTVYSDSTNNTELGVYRFVGRRSTALTMAAPPWNGLWAVELTGYEVPA